MIKKKKCEHCGKEFETKQAFQKFCCSRCCYKHKLESDKLKRQRAKMSKTAVSFKGFKLWDINDPECRETALFIRTIKPIDFKALEGTK